MCARNDLVYLQPAIYPFEAMHLGNGNLGVSLWNEGGITWQLNNGSYRLATEAVSSGRLTLTFPAMVQANPKSFRQQLHLWDDTVSTEIEGPSGSASLTSFVAEGEDGLVVRCRHTGAGNHVLKLHLWPSRTQARFVQGADFVAITEHADHVEDFLATDMALMVQAPGVPVKIGRQDDRTVTITITDAPSSYTLYVANPLHRGPTGSALKAGKEMIARLEAKGYDTLLAERRAFCHAFWPKSFFHITSSTGEGDFLEKPLVSVQL